MGKEPEIAPVKYAEAPDRKLARQLLHEIAKCLCATCSFLSADFRVTERHVQNQFGGDIPLISISSFRRSHSMTDINKVMKDKM